MESLFALALSAGYFTLIFQFLAPWFSGREVSFTNTSTIGPKLLFGLLMSIGNSVIIGILLSIFGVFFVFALAGTVAMPISGVLAGVSILVLIALGVLALQVPCWLMTLLMGKLMPETIKVSSSRAAWKAAWANTLVSAIPFAFFLFIFAATLAASLASLHVH